jgi:hypothetical protein
MNVEERLARLERENRRLKVAGLLALLVVASVFLMGQTRVPQRIEARSFAVLNPYGQAVVVLDADQIPDWRQGNGRITLADAHGHDTLTFQWLDDGPHLLMFHEPEPDGSIPVKWQAP